jgi:hypothetical protein
MRTKFWSATLNGGDHLEDQGLGGNNIKMDLKEAGWESVVWIRMGQDMDRWQALVSTVMNLRLS